MEEDLSGIAGAKAGSRVCCSTQEGTVYVFKWDWFGDCVDRIRGHPSSIDAMVRFDQDTLLTGCEDGLVRAVSVNPGKVISIINSDTEPEDLVPISALSVSHNGRFVAFANHDFVVNFRSTQDLIGRTVEAELEPEASMEEAKEERKEEEKDWHEIEHQFEYPSSSEEEEAPARKRRLNTKNPNEAKSKSELERSK